MAQVAWFPVDPNNGDAEAQHFLLPPGIQPNNAVFGAVNLPKPLTWQQREHIDQRRNILGRIGGLLMWNAQLVIGRTGESKAVQMQKTWALARKLEVLLFLQSASLLEYCNIESLARRVQAVTASIVNKKIRKENCDQNAGSRSNGVGHLPPTKIAPITGSNVHVSSLARTSSVASLKRSTTDMNHIPYDYPTNIQRVSMPMSKRVRIYREPNVRREHVLGGLLFRGHEELGKIIWSYVDGVHIMRLRAVCRVARIQLPLFVTSLQLSCNGIQRALTTHRIDFHTNDPSGCILRECINLQQLDVISLSSGMTFGKLSMRAMNCPQRFVVTHDDHEQIVLALSEQLRLNAFPRLTRLGLTCLFTNEEADGEADVLLNNLMTGCCPQLEELCLPGNSFGDYGAIKLAQMIRSRVCPKLKRLDLRRNFIAEQGIRSLCHALADGSAPNLVELCLGGNTITDSCFHHILFAMESRHLSKLRFLGIEMNYLTALSMEMLGRTIGKLVCPELSQVSYSDNSCVDTDAKRLIASAVYQERMFRLQQQQLQIQSQVKHKQAFPQHMGMSAPPRFYNEYQFSSGEEDDQFSSDGE